MNEHFCGDTLLSVATVNDRVSNAKIVNSYYEDYSFYIITYALSHKMKQIKKNPIASVCGEWFPAHGIGENTGHIQKKKMKK